MIELAVFYPATGLETLMIIFHQPAAFIPGDDPTGRHYVGNEQRGEQEPFDRFRSRRWLRFPGPYDCQGERRRLRQIARWLERHRTPTEMHRGFPLRGRGCGRYLDGIVTLRRRGPLTCDGEQTLALSSDLGLQNTVMVGPDDKVLLVTAASGQILVNITLAVTDMHPAHAVRRTANSRDRLL